ncbi:MAG: outer membrane beta-barrel protein [Smithella sp.]|jgi:opacity protein-like surface antigen|nr:outer membrane beta-barrel protein [Smithella sp.]
MRIYARVFVSIVALIILSLSSSSFAQNLSELKGVQLLDGTKIYGKVTKLNVNDVLIQKIDGTTVTVKFDEVSNFLKDQASGYTARDEKTASDAKKGDGLYIGANLGITLLRDFDIKDIQPTLSVQSDPGFAIGATVGYAIDFIRIEAEVAYQKNGIDKFKGLDKTTYTSDNTSNITFLLNGYFDFKNKTIVTPFLSAGAGVARISISEINEKVNISGKTYSVLMPSSHATVFAYQLGAGLAFAVTKNVTLDVKYRYFGTTDPKFDDAKVNDGITDTLFRDVQANYASHNAYLGLRYSF